MIIDKYNFCDLFFRDKYSYFLKNIIEEDIIFQDLDLEQESIRLNNHYIQMKLNISVTLNNSKIKRFNCCTDHMILNNSNIDYLALELEKKKNKLILNNSKIKSLDIINLLDASLAIIGKGNISGVYNDWIRSELKIISDIDFPASSEIEVVPINNLSKKLYY